MPDIRKGFSMDIASWSRTDYTDYVTLHLDTFSKNITAKALELYPYRRDPELPLMDLMSDIRVNCATNVVTEAAAKSLPGMVYRYVVTSCPSSPVYALGLPFGARYAFHLWDIFGFFDAVGMYMKGNPTKADYNFANTMQDNIMHFAKTGNVLSPWKSYDKQNIALIGEFIKVSPTYRKNECDFWLNNSFFDYAWMN